MSEDPLLGQVLEGRYRVEALIGEGGMGRVYRGLHVELNAPRAIKVLRSELAKDAAFVERFEAEARVAEELRHPNLVTVHDLGRLDDGTPYIVSELVEGETLSELFRRQHTFTPQETCEWLCQLASGLSLAHRRGIVHRDIAPDNVMVTGHGGDEVTVRLLDFGIAKQPLAKGGPDTGSSVFLGKLGYASPEQMGALPEGEPLDPRTDVFSLTAVAYQMLTGELPWKKDTLQAYVHDLLMRPEPIAMEAVRASVPDRWADLIGAGLARDRERRIPDMESLAARLREAVAPPAEATPATAPDERPQTAAARSGRAWIAAATIAVASVLGLSWFASRPTTSPPSPSRTVADRGTPLPTPPLAPSIEPAPTSLAADTATDPTPAVVQPTPLPEPSATPDSTRPPTPPPTPAPTPPPQPTPARAAEQLLPTVAGDAPPGPATLRISSDPEAEVQLNGVLLGRTPRSIEGLAPGLHELLLRADDGRTHREKLDLAAGGESSFEHQFPGYGALSLVSATWAIVRVDDGPELETPVRIERLVAGDHVVEATRPGFETRRIPVTIEEGRSHTLVVDLKRER